MGEWYYGYFPVQPASELGANDGTVILAGQANEIREAVARRASLIGVSVTLPDEVEDQELCYLEWLTGMRAAVEQLLAAGRYGYFRREGEWPYTWLNWVAWTKETVLQRVHTDFVQNLLVTNGGDWMQAADADHAVPDPTMGPDPSIMYADHINELYYVLEFLAYIVVMQNCAPNPISADRAFGYAQGPGPPDNPASMQQAYQGAWAAFNAGGYFAVPPDIGAVAASRLVADWYTGQHNCSEYDQRVRDVAVTIPALAHPIIELAVPFEWHESGYIDPTWLAGFSCWMGANFTGSQSPLRFGDMQVDSMGRQFRGWIAWTGRFNNEAVHFSFKWPNVQPGYWGGEFLHDSYRGASLYTYLPLIGGFDFSDESRRYRNITWRPILMNEWGNPWPWA